MAPQCHQNFLHWTLDKAGICEVVVCPCGPAVAGQVMAGSKLAGGLAILEKTLSPFEITGLCTMEFHVHPQIEIIQWICTWNPFDNFHVLW